MNPDTSPAPDAPPSDSPAGAFAALGLSAPVLSALRGVGYEVPSPIQAQCIPPMLAGRDVLGQAQTGTGKTAAFALPILSRIDAEARLPQALVLAPTRELAIQVAEAFQRYAEHIPGFHVLPIYGGQGYGPQLGALKRGVHVVVGTPGRIIDHLGRGSLDLSQLRWMVLDEADEMLRMGFIDDVEAVFQKTPPGRQVALFSATMPAPIRRIAQTHLRDPVEVTVAARTATAENIRQRYWWVGGVHKLDALTRILETETFEAMLVFARTRQATEELAQKLEARGFAAAAIHGEVQQSQREKTVQRLRDGQLDILVATDVAARGLDVERITHVLNYDIPYDTESYIHRIGRTGRAGRKGEAILFVAPRERGMLRAIERATRQPIEPMPLPSAEAVNESRMTRFSSRIDETLAGTDWQPYIELLQRYLHAREVDPLSLAAALAHLAQGERPLLLPPDAPAERAPRSADSRGGRDDRGERERRPTRDAREEHPRKAAAERRPREGVSGSSAPATPRERDLARAERRERERSVRGPAVDAAPPGADARQAPPRAREADEALETFRVEVGSSHGVRPANLVGAIANEAGLDSRYIGRIDIREDHSLVDLPPGMPKELLQHLKKVWVSGRMLRISRVEDGTAPSAQRRAGKAPPRKPPRRRDG